MHVDLDVTWISIIMEIIYDNYLFIKMMVVPYGSYM